MLRPLLQLAPARLLAALCLPALLASALVAQEPDNRSLNVRDHELNEELARQGEESYLRGIAALERFEGMLAAGTLERASLQEIGSIFVAAQQLRRYGDQLVVLGEPAGKDFALRGRALEVRLQAVRAACTRLPGYQDKLTQLLIEYERHATAHARNVTTIEQLIQERKWNEAYSAMFDIVDDLDQFAFWFTRRENGTLNSPFHQVRRTLDRARQQFGPSEARTQIEGDLDAARPDFESLSAALEKLPELNSDGTTLYKAERLPCPQALEKCLADWLATHRRILQTHALQAALWSAGNDTTSLAAADVAEYRQFCQLAGQSLKDMIDADAERTSPAQAAQRHAEYVAALAPWVGQESSGLIADLRPALDRLAARSDDFSAQLTAYQAATDDYLRWCERVADDEAAWRVAESYPNFEPDYLLYSEKFDDDVAGLHNPGANSTDRVRLLSDVPSTTARLREHIVGNNYSFGSAVGLGDSRALLHYRLRASAGLALPTNWQEGVDRLEAQLLADADHPPLSLNAAAALASARRGDLLAAGANVRSLELLGVTPFFATLNPSLTLVTPLGAVPDDPVNAESVEQVFLRYLLETHWARHRYFFIGQSGS